MSPCPSEDTLLCLMGGELSAAERKTLGRHLDDCAECGELFRLLAADLRGERSLLTAPTQADSSITKLQLSTDAPTELSPTASLQPPSRFPQPGDVFGGRFRVTRLVAAGGMGAVFESEDQLSGDIVALKVPLLQSYHRRIEREARTHSTLRHPVFVRHLAHSLDEEETPFIAMEWIAGISLRQYLDRGPISIEASLKLIATLADALDELHQRGLIHRDVKPANIMLQEGKLERPRLLDFGLIRSSGEGHSLTLSGQAIGTASYMAPEQARGVTDIDARADVFSLGCVLYECLTGKRLFTGSDLLAILMKVLLEPVPRLKDGCPGASSAVERAFQRMTAKAPAERPADGSAVHALMHGLMATPPKRASVPPASISDRERELVTVMAIPSISRSYGLSQSERDSLHEIIVAYGGNTVQLIGGSWAGTWRAIHPATDQVRAASLCAFELLSVTNCERISIATGTSNNDGELNIGPIVDTAIQLLQTETKASAVFLDETTASLIEHQLPLQSMAGIPCLLPRDIAASRLDLRPDKLPMIGRRAPLQSALAIAAETYEDEFSRALLVTGDAGIGKSRLCREILRSILEASPQVRAISVGIEPSQARSTYGLASALLRNLIGAPHSTTRAGMRAQLRHFVARNIDLSERATTELFLGELLGLGAEAASESLIGRARQDPALMHEQIRGAWLRVFLACTEQHPLLLTLENIHWADRGSIELCGLLLKHQDPLPVFVVANARPQIHERFPTLWTESEMTEIKLRPLNPRACAEYIRLASPTEVHDDAQALLLHYAEGNPLYLRELLRAHLEDVTITPAPIQTMLRARLAGLPVDQRRLLRAASVLGIRFTVAGAQTVAGMPAAQAHGLLQDLESQGYIRQIQAEVAGPLSEYAFEQPLFHETCYASLTESDTQVAHRNAAQFLSRHGGSSPAVLAQHLTQAGDHEDAASHWLTASRQALAACDFLLARRQAEAALAHPVPRELEVDFCNVLARALAWMGESTECARYAARGYELADVGTESWYILSGWVPWAAQKAGDHAALIAALQRLSEHVASSGPDDDLAFRESCEIAIELFPREVGPEVVQEILRPARDPSRWSKLRPHPRNAQLRLMYEIREHIIRGDSFGTLPLFPRLVREHRRLGSVVHEIQFTFEHATMLRQLGQLDEAVRLFSQCLEQTLRRSMTPQAIASRLRLADVQIERGNLHAAELELGALAQLPSRMQAPHQREVAWLWARHAVASHQLTLARERLHALDEAPLPLSQTDLQIRALRATLALEAGEAEAVCTLLDEALLASSASSMARPLSRRIHWLRAQALLALSRPAEANAVLAPALEALTTLLGSEHLDAAAKNAFLKADDNSALHAQLSTPLSSK